MNFYIDRLRKYKTIKQQTQYSCMSKYHQNTVTRNQHLSTCLTMRSFTKFFTSVEFWSLKPTTFSPPVLSDVRTILNHCIRFIQFQTKHTLPLQTSTAGRQSKDVTPCRWRLQAWSKVSKLVYKNSTNRNCFNRRNNNENTSAFMYDLRTSWSDLHCLKLFNHTK